MIIELKKISKFYENLQTNTKLTVLNEITFSIDKGDSVAIVGPSGSGKSTLLNIIGTLDKPSSGIVKFNGNEINQLNDNQLSEIRNKNIGFVFQLHYLLPQLNLIENVLLPAIPKNEKSRQKETLERAMNLLETVGLADKIYQLPSQLSGGESQRAAVVRALINQPELILADEPTGSLDAESAQRIGELLSSINKNNKVAIIVVTHSEELAKKMNVIYKLRNGELVKF